MGYTEEQEKELYFANTVIGAIKNVKVPMLMYEEEKNVVEKALCMYIDKIESDRYRQERENRMYIYEGHMGELYTSDESLDYEDLYCEECGDSDWLIGYAATREEAWNLLKNDTDINGSGGWSYDYIQEFLKNWEE